MTKRMLIDATHAEETRVVVLDGNRLEEYDVETSTKKQLKGNIYLAKVVRVEPSLQAAFVEYGGNRHGFLAFGEIHPDYYQIPVADRQRLIELQEQQARDEEEEEDRAAGLASGPHGEAHRAAAAPMPLDAEQPEIGFAPALPPPLAPEETPREGIDPPPAESGPAELGPIESAPIESAPIESGPAESVLGPSEAERALEAEAAGAEASVPHPEPPAGEGVPHRYTQAAPIAQDILVPPQDAQELFAPPDRLALLPLPVEAGLPAQTLGADLAPEAAEPAIESVAGAPEPTAEVAHELDVPAEDAPPPETLGGAEDMAEEARERRIPPRFLRNYKIQEVIRRRQILLVQVVKEERGTKGAALTTYISLAGRYCVLMPNSPRGGGISRKITSAADRKRLKEVTAEMELPRGMGLIVRTAGANRPKPEIKRDCEYLLRLWDDIRERTLQSVAPALIYEEASLIKRAIRDIYSRDVDDVLVDGEDGFRAARDFMRMLMPTHVRKVQLWRDGGLPLFARSGVEAQLDHMLNPTVQLRSGGYLVINQTEALVAIDVNSGRSTRERGIEETALRTNLEAADEVARQLRLRDLAGLIVIDFIDMESKKHNAAVERRLKEALKNDRARIQVGSISHFGLLEMSRQRLRPSLAETSSVVCPHCGGTGHVRSTESAAMHVLRAIEEEGSKRRAAEIAVHVASSVALYILNHKRAWISEIEARYAMRVTFVADDTLPPPQLRIEKLRAQDAQVIPISQGPTPLPVTQNQAMAEDAGESEDEEEDDEAEDADEEAISPPDQGVAAASSAEEQERRRRRRRRRRRGRREEDGAAPEGDGQGEGEGEAAPMDEAVARPDNEPEEIEEAEATEVAAVAEAPPRAEAEEAGEDATGDARRRRGRRGGRRRRREEENPSPPAEFVPGYAGPTPADPFGGGHTFDIFDVIEQQMLASDAPPAPERVETKEAPPSRPQPADAPGPDAADASPLTWPTVEMQASGPDLAGASAPADPAPEAQAHGPDPAAASEPTFAPEAQAAERDAAGALPSTGPAPEAEALAAMPDPIPVSAGPDSAPLPDSEALPVAAGPAIQPVIVDETTAPAEKKRGWWRR